MRAPAKDHPQASPTPRTKSSKRSISRQGKSAVARPQPSPSIDVAQLRRRLGLTRKVFSRLCHYSERAIAAWESGSALTAASEKRMVELQRLQRALAKVMQSDYVGAWIETPNAAFGGLKPLEVMERGESDRIWRMIYELESGVPG